MANTAVGLTGSLSLAGLLRAFTAPEMVKGVRCNKCSPEGGAPDSAPAPHPYTKHIKTVSIGKLPACLCLHVARVEWAAGGLSKRSDHVTFPEHLNMAPYAAHAHAQMEVPLLAARAGAGAGAGAGLAAGCGYRLSAVVVHVGGARSGHFATYRRGNGIESRRWWYTSDTLVHEVSLAEVLRCSAYLLYYERERGAPPPLAPAAAPPTTTHF